MKYSVYQYLLKSFMCDIIFRFDNIWGGSKIYHEILKSVETYEFFVSPCSKQL